MKKLKKTLFLIFAFMATLRLDAQPLGQTVRGHITDLDGKFDLPGATVTLIGTNQKNTITDTNGRFRFEDVAIGRVNLKISYIGYEDRFVNNLEVTSGKEVVLEIELRESLVMMEDVVVKARKKGKVGNELSLVSGLSVTVDETQRYAGSFNDPARMVSSFAGVTANPEGNNDIIVRGNSPKYIQWRLEGIEIPNPNHFGDVGSSGGPISALNSNILANSDFYTGAFSPEYGNVLSGVFDVKFRNGNNEKREHTLGIGALGIEATLEGPFKKGYAGSYLINYRYSSLALLDNLNLVDFGGIPKYQDASFKINLPTKSAGSFTFFGLGGKSSIEEISEFTQNVYLRSGEVFNKEIKSNFVLNNHLYTVGVNHVLPLTKNSFIQTSIAYSGNGINEEEEEAFDGIIQLAGTAVRDSMSAKYQTYQAKLTDHSLTAAAKYSIKVNARHKLEAGSKYIFLQNDYLTSFAYQNSFESYDALKLNKGLATYRNYLAWQYRANEKLTFVGGMHHYFVPFSGEHSLEPRAGARYQLNPTLAVNMGYGRHSRMEHISTYFAKVEDENGLFSEPNKNLKLLKANHLVIGIEKRFGVGLLGKIEGYYQGLSDIPVSASGNYYSTLNETAGFYDVALVSKGTGKNYGVEFTLERFFQDNFYYLFSGSIYDSKYKSLDGVERNTQYNGNYAFNFLAGKEFVNLGKKKNKTIGLNAKVFYIGARKIIPLLRDEAGNLSVNPAKGEYYDLSKAYENGLDDVFQINASLSFKINKQKAMHEFALDVINANNTKARLYEYYDETQPSKIGYGEPLSFLPNILYRVHF